MNARASYVQGEATRSPSHTPELQLNRFTLPRLKSSHQPHKRTEKRSAKTLQRGGRKLKSIKNPLKHTQTLKEEAHTKKNPTQRPKTPQVSVQSFKPVDREAEHKKRHRSHPFGRWAPLGDWGEIRTHARTHANNKGGIYRVQLNAKSHQRQNP